MGFILLPSRHISLETAKSSFLCKRLCNHCATTQQIRRYEHNWDSRRSGQGAVRHKNQVKTASMSEISATAFRVVSLPTADKLSISGAIKRLAALTREKIQCVVHALNMCKSNGICRTADQLDSHHGIAR
jgi:hypothetical protein